MAAAERFEVDLLGETVRGSLHAPHDSSEDRRPAVMICLGVASQGDAIAALVDELVEQLTAAGLLVAVPDDRCQSLILQDFDRRGINDELREGAAVLDWLAHRPEVKSDRIGVLGLSVGAVCALALAAEDALAARLCLVSPVAAESVREASGRSAPAGPLTHLPAAFAPSLARLDSAALAAAFGKPLLIVQGAADRIAPWEPWLEIAGTARAAGHPVSHVHVARANHAMSGRDSAQACAAHVARFFAGMALQARKPEPDAAQRA